MQFVNIRDFKIHATKYLREKEELVITRRKEPIVVLSPVEKESVRAALLKIGQVFNQAKISKKTVLKVLEQVRKQIYGSDYY